MGPGIFTTNTTPYHHRSIKNIGLKSWTLSRVVVPSLTAHYSHLDSFARNNTSGWTPHPGHQPPGSATQVLVCYFNLSRLFQCVARLRMTGYRVKLGFKAFLDYPLPQISKWGVRGRKEDTITMTPNSELE